MRLREEIPKLEIVKTWLNSYSVTKKELNGKPTLVHFWSISCSSCKNQLKKINLLQQQYKNDFHIVGVHMPRTETDKDAKKVNDIAREYHMNYPVAIDNEDVLTNAFRNQMVPSYYIFDENGVLRYYQTGTSAMGLFERRIHRIVQKAPS